MVNDVYFRIQENDAIPTECELPDPKYIARMIKAYFQDKCSEGALSLSNWAPGSPDCNPIELFWNHLDSEVRGKSPTGKAALCNVLQ
ncbi:hypothetical protein Trydic_g9632 [Trypoxylus dichotomus]